MDPSLVQSDAEVSANYGYHPKTGVTRDNFPHQFSSYMNIVH